MTLIDKDDMMTERYEHMRAMRRMHGSRTQEMELLIAAGMYGWMQAWAKYESPVAPADPRTPGCITGAPVLRPPIREAARGEAVGIYSAMIWDIVKEEVHAYDG